MNKTHLKSLGYQAEQYVAETLVLERGWTVVARNYACVGGEIDLIFHDAATDSLVFVEVKYRQRPVRGIPELQSLLGRRKRMAMMRAAADFLCKNPENPCYAQRFDLALIGGVAPHFQWVAHFEGVLNEAGVPVGSGYGE
ncbi:MAG: YraN family protein [Zetaproteobacteria bacterium]|nr:YraN family protein [Zetaproteobacteria bacterium]